MVEPKRSITSSSYRYGFNGQEKDDEINAVPGANTTAEYWEYDSRLGRRWNTDPIFQISESPYATFDNNPLYYNDPDGDDPNGQSSHPAAHKISNFFLSLQHFFQSGFTETGAGPYQKTGFKGFNNLFAHQNKPQTPSNKNPKEPNPEHTERPNEKPEKYKEYRVRFYEDFSLEKYGKLQVFNGRSISPESTNINTTMPADVFDHWRLHAPGQASADGLSIQGNGYNGLNFNLRVSNSKSLQATVSFEASMPFDPSTPSDPLAGQQSLGPLDSETPDGMSISGISKEYTERVPINKLGIPQWNKAKYYKRKPNRKTKRVRQEEYNHQQVE